MAGDGTGVSAAHMNSFGSPMAEHARNSLTNVSS